MIEILREDERFTIRFSKNDLSDELLQELLRKLEIEQLLSENRMTPEQAWQLSEEIKEDWWKKNKASILKNIGVHETDENNC
jgi:hypothetical protein